MTSRLSPERKHERESVIKNLLAIYHIRGPSSFNTDHQWMSASLEELLQELDVVRAELTQCKQLKEADNAALKRVEAELVKAKKEIEYHEWNIDVYMLKNQLALSQAENVRLNLLIKIADELITNENAKEDWKNAKQVRVM